MSSRTIRNTSSASPGLGSTRPSSRVLYTHGMVVMVIRPVGTFLSSMLRSYSLSILLRPGSTTMALMAACARLLSFTGLLSLAFLRNSRAIEFMYMCWAWVRPRSVPSSKP